VLAPARGPSATPSEGALLCEPLVARRLAEPFERLRDAGEAARARVFLAGVGTAADFTPRAAFARSAFEAGGIAAIGDDSFTDFAKLAEAFRASGTRLACLCSSDEVYATSAEAAARALKQAGAAAIYLAGRPGDHEAAFRDAGIDAYLFAGGDLLAFLEEAHRRLGIPRRAEP
jgi:methylmalonyl-CoA mutase